MKKLHLQNIIAFFLIVYATQANALMTREVEVNCPYDSQIVRYSQILSSSSFGAMLDFKPYGSIIAPSPIASCSNTGFVFYEEKISDETFEKLRPYVFSDEFKKHKSEMPYFRAAKLLEYLGTIPDTLMWVYVYATWEAEGTPQYDRYAEEVIARLPASIERQKDPTINQRLNLLMVEMLRRTKNFSKAETYLNEFFPKLKQDSQEQKVGLYQRALINKGDWLPHMITRDILK